MKNPQKQLSDCCNAPILEELAGPDMGREACVKCFKYLDESPKPAQLAGEGENSEEYYILVQDQDSHWYVIPDLKQKEWQQWNESPNYGYEDLPNWAKEVGGWYGLVKFTNFIIK